MSHTGEACKASRLTRVDDAYQEAWLEADVQITISSTATGSPWCRICSAARNGSISYPPWHLSISCPCQRAVNALAAWHARDHL